MAHRTIFSHAALAALLVAAAIGQRAAAQAPTTGLSADAADVLGLEQKVEEAVVKGDVTFFERVSTPDFTFVHGDGWTTGGAPLAADDKAAFLKRIAGKEYLVHDLDRVKTEMHGDVAITYGRYVSLFVPKAPSPNAATPRLTSIWFERVYAKRDGQWKFVSHRTVHGPNPAPAGVDPTAADLSGAPPNRPAARGPQPGAGGRGARPSASAKAEARSADTVDVLKLDQTIADAVVRGDTSYVDGVTPDDFVMVHGDGWTYGGKPLLTDTKASFVKRVAGKAYTVLDFDSVNAEMHGDIAITFGRYLAHTASGPADRAWFSVWFERVYAKRDGRWMYLSHRTVHGPTFGLDRASVSDK
jgi:uncharacterized protein DUF4440